MWNEADQRVEHVAGVMAEATDAWRRAKCEDAISTPSAGHRGHGHDWTPTRATARVRPDIEASHGATRARNNGPSGGALSTGSMTAT